jgi:hypothetical protein
MNLQADKKPIALAVAAVLGAASLVAIPESTLAAKAPGKYVAGDFHNHSTCSDGSISMQKLVKKSTDKNDTPWGLDWFVQAGHGGTGNRNCTLAEDASLSTPAYPLVYSTTGQLQGPNTTWLNTNPPVEVKGNVSGSGSNRNMWRWQSLQEFQYPITEYLNAYLDKPLFLGLESVVAGHEHTSMSVITGQIPAGLDQRSLPTSAGYTPLGNANALSMWTYCFDRNTSDTSRGNTTATSGVGNNWDCSVPGSLNQADPSWNVAAAKLVPASGAGTGVRGHNKTVEALKWMKAFHPEASYYVPAHLERAGPFNPDGNNGFNVEHLRNFNNAAPFVAFGFETQPGHGASGDRGEYRPLRNNFGSAGLVDSVGGTTYGGTGVYGAQVGGVWDALLGEGRNWWFFASSDWHNRGSFGPDDRRSTNDFYPGEYQRNYTMVRNGGARKLSPQAIVDGLRTGNGYADSGQLVDRLAFVACIGNPAPHGRSNQAVESLALNAALNNSDLDFKGCATMGEKLAVPRGTDVVVAVVVRDPAGTNYSPYTFDNPSLAQIGISQSLNAPVLDRIDVIRGLVTGYKDPNGPDYAGEWPRTWLINPDMGTVPAAAKNTSATVIKTFNGATWTTVRRDPEFKVMSFRIPAVQASQYVRLRGTNLPVAVPYETDADGNPLTDLYTNMNRDVDPSNLRIRCTVTGKNVPGNGEAYTGDAIDGCPNHLPEVDGVKYVAFDVAAWADLWFYSNPIFVEVQGATLVAGVK